MTRIWDSEKVFLNGDEYFRSIIDEIEHARAYITLEFYIFNDDILGQAIAHALIQAAYRGVKIEIIVDGVGSYDLMRTIYPRLVEAKIDVKVYNPLPFIHPYFGQLNFLRKIQAFGMRFLRMNKRNHRKIITIDEQILYAGSFNITSEHTRLLGNPGWKDMGLRLTGEHVKYAVLQFKRGWKLREYHQYKKKNKAGLVPWKDSPLRLNSTIFMKRFYQKQFINKLKSSTVRAWLMTPYFIPQRGFVKAMVKAAKRGVDVRLILSTKTDVEIFVTLQTFYYPFLIKSGVKIYLYSTSVLHAKSYIFDDWMTIGSSNLNHRSLMHDLEVDLVIQEPENLRLLEKDFEESVESITPLTKAYLNEISFFHKALSRLFFIFRYWL